MFLVLGLGVLANLLALSWTEVYGIPLSFSASVGSTYPVIPCLWLFKYGKPRGYLRDLLMWQIKPHIYCGPRTRPRTG